MKRTSSPLAALRARALASLAALACLSPPVALALDETRADVTSFIRELVEKHGFESAALAKVFAQAESRPSIIEAMQRPAEKTLAWHEYRGKFLTERRIARVVDVWREQEAALLKAEESGVPAKVILGIVGVETFFGETERGLRGEVGEPTQESGHRGRCTRGARVVARVEGTVQRFLVVEDSITVREWIAAALEELDRPVKIDLAA